MTEQFQRTISLIGQKAQEKLFNSKVIIFGIGGVGSYCAEALIRMGVGQLAFVDNDTINETNLNRQIIALHSTLGQYKVDVMKQRALDINPSAIIETYKTFYLPENASEFDFSKYDYVIDAIDTVKAKLSLIEEANKTATPIISSMGTGNKLDPSQLKVENIHKTSVCPLARVMRTELKKRKINKLKVVYSKEVPVKNFDRVPSSNSFVPASAGLLIASEVIKDLINN